jgi:predicted ferric reductase
MSVANSAPSIAAVPTVRRRVQPQGKGQFTVTPGARITLIATGALGAAALAVRGAPTPVQFNVPLVAHLSGMLAGYGVALMLVLMSRVPALERGVGADRLARWHAPGGRANFVLIAIHAVCATLAWTSLTGLSIGLAMLRLLRLPWLLPATTGTIMIFAIGVASMRAARRRLSYERWHLLHLSAYLAAGLAFVHQLAGPDLAGWRIGQIIWSLLYTFTYFLVLRYRLVAPIYQVWRHRLKVQQVIPEADGVVSIVVSGKHIHELEAESGQFFRWRFLTPRTWMSAHPFSLPAPPALRPAAVDGESAWRGQ